jgi:hypothetical protein
MRRTVSTVLVALAAALALALPAGAAAAEAVVTASGSSLATADLMVTAVPTLPSDAPTEPKDSAAGRAVFIGITLALIVAGIVLSLRYRKR